MTQVRAGLARWAPVIVYMAIIFYASSQASFPKAVELVWDKARHAGGFAVLAILWLWGLTDRFRRPLTGRVALAAWLLTTVYGASDEWHQSFVPTRQMDAADLLADTLGAALAMAGALVTSARWRSDRL